MCRVYLIYFLCIFIIVVNSMSLKGPVLTRYDPCGLGVVHFDKLSNGLWQCIIHFGLYSGYNAVETEVTFEEPVTIYNTLNRSLINSTNVLVRRMAPIPEKYIFDLKTINGGTPFVSHFILNNITLCSKDIKIRYPTQSNFVTQIFAEKQAPHVCGRRFLNHTELVSIRTEAKAGEWPWHVAMFISNIGLPLDSPNFMTYQCGGSIISPTAVLTAAHCMYKNNHFYEPSRIWIIAGANNYQDVNHVGRQVRQANRIILHPAYGYEVSTSDLAIIKVNSLKYNEYVQPICIWGPAYDKTNLFGVEALIVGFGRNEDEKFSPILRSSFIKVQPDEECTKFNPQIYEKLLDEFTFCAGYGPNSTINPRNGDSGGGLVVGVPQPDHRLSWFLRGVLSKCGVSPNKTYCDPTYYVVYTDVGPHYGWIHHHSDLEFHVNIH